MATILFSIRPDDGRPVYRQIVDQVKAALASGKLRPATNCRPIATSRATSWSRRSR
jgi:DNA-binding transcriptional regulator YhcF (GntR family)